MNHQSQDICARLGMVPHGHKSAVYETLLDGGGLPVPLLDKHSDRLKPDVDVLPIGDKLAPDVHPEVEADIEVEGDELEKRLALLRDASMFEYGSAQHVLVLQPLKDSSFVCSS